MAFDTASPQEESDTEGKPFGTGIAAPHFERRVTLYGDVAPEAVKPRIGIPRASTNDPTFESSEKQRLISATTSRLQELAGQLDGIAAGQESLRRTVIVTCLVVSAIIIAVAAGTAILVAGINIDTSGN